MRFPFFDATATLLRPGTHRPMPAVRAALLGVLAVTAGTAARGEPSIPFTPSLVGRHAIELLVDEAGLDLTVMQWPLPRAAVQRAIDALPKVLPSRLDNARFFVLSELQEQAASQMSITVRGRQDALVGFGGDATPGSSVGLRTDTLSGHGIALQLGGRSEVTSRDAQGGARFRLDDSAIAVEAYGVQLQAWSHRSWWGPGWQSSLALSNNAPAFNGFGFQRASASTSESPWLSWLGPWNFEFFVAQSEDGERPAYPFIIGNRLTFRPFSNVEIGVTRMAQWGGRGRPQSLSSFANALTGAGTNADTTAQQAVDPANQLAGFDFRVGCGFGLRCAGYTQLIGEDQAGIWPSHYLALYGAEAWSEDGFQRVFAEYATTSCSSAFGQTPLDGCAYRNYSYPEGYTNARRWIGANVGPDSRLLTLGWLEAGSGTSIKLHVGEVGSRIGTFSPIDADPQTSGHLIGISTQRSFTFGSATLTPQFDWSRIHALDGTRIDRRVGANLRFPLDSAYQFASGSLGDALSSSGESAWTPLWVGASLIAASTLFDHTTDDYARRQGDNRSAKALTDVGNAVPVLGVGLAGASWLLQHGSPQGDLGFAAMSAGLSAYVLSDVTKYAVDRARPTDGLGARSFGDAPRSNASFPSSHAAVAWAVVTPYAKAYDMPWLYGLAALTNVGRVMGRDHWVSDTVAGAVIGYYVGDWWFRRSGLGKDKPGMRLSLTPRSVLFDMDFE